MQFIAWTIAIGIGWAAWKFAKTVSAQRRDEVSESYLSNLRSSTEAEADLHESLGTPVIKRPERVVKASSAPGAMSRPWSSR